jgi:hypothetical protein
MSFLRDFARGLLLMSVAIMSVAVAALLTLGHEWMGGVLFLTLPVPVSVIVYDYLRHRRGNSERFFTAYRFRQTAAVLCGVSFACWLFDVTTTYYAIDVLGVAGELNPLGWPFGAFGPLLFYVPASVFVYWLLWKVQRGYSLLAASLVVILVLFIGAMNLYAGFHNFSLGVTFSKPLPTSVYVLLLSMAVVANAVGAVFFMKLTGFRLGRLKPSRLTVVTILSILALGGSVAAPIYSMVMNGNEIRGEPSFDLSGLYVAHTYTYLEIRNNGTADAQDVTVTVYFVKPLESNSTDRFFEWATIERIPEIKRGTIGIITIPVGSYQMKTTYPEVDPIDYEAHIDAFCVYDRREIRATFHLQHVQILP